MKVEPIRTVTKYRIEYTLNGKLHREDGPAVIRFDGTMWWCKDGIVHRTDGPAYIWNNGVMDYVNNGNRYNIDGTPVYNYHDNDIEF